MSVSFQEFEQHFKAGKTQLVYRLLRADLETPVSTYMKLCGNDPYCFLLESIEGGETLGRYSFIGFDPDLIWRDDEHDDPLVSLKNTLKDCEIDVVPNDLPPMAASGLFGYMGYDMIRLIEDIPDSNPDDLNIPRSILIRPQALVIFDNIKNQMFLVSPVYVSGGDGQDDAKTVYDAAIKRLDDIEEKLAQAIPQNLMGNISKIKTPLDVRSNIEPDAFKKSVEKAIDYIHEGEIFQVVLGQRFEMDFDLPSIDLYRALRVLNPSPFMVHMQFADFSLVASSPEILVRVRNNIVTIRPIAGTRPRGATAAEDQAHAEDLLADEKERAEHLMLLDLGRNDVGRVAEFGSVNVTAEFEVEYYSHVMHIVSNVEGKLKKDFDIIDAHFAGFPAGTVSGAPKIRAMEIIDELETSKRSYYAGSIGYFSGHGEMDSCIALRTALVKGGKCYIQAGAGIVADSKPDAEYEETVNKSKALVKAAEMAIAYSKKA